MLFGFGDSSDDDLQAQAQEFWAEEDYLSGASSSSGSSSSSSSASSSSSSSPWTQIGTTALNDVANVVSAAFGLKKTTTPTAAQQAAAAAAAAAKQRELLIVGGIVAVGVVGYIALQRRRAA